MKQKNSGQLVPDHLHFGVPIVHPPVLALLEKWRHPFQHACIDDPHIPIATNRLKPEHLGEVSSPLLGRGKIESDIEWDPLPSASNTHNGSKSPRG